MSGAAGPTASTGLTGAAGDLSAQWRDAARILGPHDAPIRQNTCGCGALRDARTVGPFIRLRGYDTDDGTWRATVLYGTTSIGGSPGGGGDESEAEAGGLIELSQPAESDAGSGSSAAAASAAAAASRLLAGRKPPLLHYRILSAGSAGKAAGGGGGGGSRVHDGQSGPSGGGGVAAAATLRPLPLAAFSRQIFWRFDLSVTVLDTEAQWLEYRVESGEAEEVVSEHQYRHGKEPTAAEPIGGDGGGGGGGGSSHRVYVPSRVEDWRWAFYSCAGFSLDVSAEDQASKFRGSFPLWTDLMRRHAQSPFCALVGGGDQLYNDDVWQVPALEAWLNLPDPDQRLAAPFSPAMKSQALSYYVRHYCTHYMSEPVREAYGSIPQVSTWDDHDIFDGWGSYPLELQTCAVFVGLMGCARDAYLLFQQHTTANRAASDGLLVTSGGGLHCLMALGPRQALLLPDQRGERNRFQVLPLESYADLFAELVRLPRLMMCFRGLYRSPFFRPLMAKTGASAAIMNKFGEPELLDDLRDHWVAPAHKGERRFLIEHLQMLAKSRTMRVSIISGDVHLCGAGLLHAWPHRPRKSPTTDWRLMHQVISSAIVNAPPPTGLVRVLQWSGRAGLTNRRTRNHLRRTFTDQPTREKLLNKRNWTEVAEDTRSGELVFSLRVESGGDAGAQPDRQHHRRLLDRLLPCLPFSGRGERQQAQQGQQQQQGQGQGQQEEPQRRPGGGETGGGVALAPAGAPASAGAGGDSGADVGGGGGAAEGGEERRGDAAAVAAGIRTYTIRVPPLVRPPQGFEDVLAGQGEDF
ncbi:hypothetical protein PLESTF_000092000 [Pleodorina starrii]|nr:hypothetical protein PLESTF_000092000 [Pleodorina starrii]